MKIPTNAAAAKAGSVHITHHVQRSPRHIGMRRIVVIRMLMIWFPSSGISKERTRRRLAAELPPGGRRGTSAAG
jgi:hypothetical protein